MAYAPRFGQRCGPEHLPLVNQIGKTLERVTTPVIPQSVANAPSGVGIHKPIIMPDGRQVTIETIKRALDYKGMPKRTQGYLSSLRTNYVNYQAQLQKHIEMMRTQLTPREEDKLFAKAMQGCDPATRALAYPGWPERYGPNRQIARRQQRLTPNDFPFDSFCEEDLEDMRTNPERNGYLAQHKMHLFEVSVLAYRQVFCFHTASRRIRVGDIEDYWRGWIFTAHGDEKRLWREQNTIPKCEESLRQIDEYITEKIFACTAAEFKAGRFSKNRDILENFQYANNHKGPSRKENLESVAALTMYAVDRLRQVRESAEARRPLLQRWKSRVLAWVVDCFA